ncbi:alpha-mannosidase, partial [Escherichia coli]|nr:alpha-mannosidase [Escherichia coli]
FIGTGGDGHTYPGATLPFGMVQLSPDTDVERWDTCSGYHRGDTSIMGFSHTHLSGTGIGDMLDVLVVPTRGRLHLLPGTLADPDAGYRQR